MNTEPLIKVRALKKSWANQIRTVAYGTALFLDIYEQLRGDYIRPQCWVSGELIIGIPNDMDAWLVEYAGNLHWIQAPRYRLGPDRAWMREEWITNLPQLFIS